MKKLTAILFSALILCSVFTMFASALESDFIVVDGEKECVIVVVPDCAATERYAAETLQSKVSEITGKTLPIVTTEPANNVNAFVVGEAAKEIIDISSMEDGGYAIKVVDNRLYIRGYGNRGTIYGVYGFLENYCGCKYFKADIVVTPQSDAIKVPANLDYKYDVFFEYADTDWDSGENIEFSIANGLSGGVYRDIPDNQGGAVEYIGQFCHTLSTVYCSADTYFAQHPEYFALRNGERTGDQLCLTNEDTYNVVLSEVLQTLEESHNPSAALQILSLTQADNENYCECDTCKALDEANGSQSGTMISFVNRIARDVKKSGYDNVAIDTFAYRYTRKAPTQVVPEKNVIVRLCTIECCFSHPLDDATCELNAGLMADLRNWAKLTGRIYVWDYTTNYANTIGIFPDFAVLQRNMQVFYENGVKGVYEEGNYYIGACNTEFGSLRSYLLAKLMQNPYCDYENEMNGFLQAYYGGGAENIKKFIDITGEAATANGIHLEIYDKMINSMSLTKNQIEECDNLWAEAETLAHGEQLENVKRSEICWRYWKAATNSGEFSPPISRLSERKQLFEDIAALGTTLMGEGRELVKYNFAQMLKSPENWQKVKDKHSELEIPDLIALCVTPVSYGIALLISLYIFILAFKRKRYGYASMLPILAAFTVVVAWNKRTFLAWDNLNSFFFSCLLLSLLFAFLLFCAVNAKRQKGDALLSKAKTAASIIFGMVLFLVPYFTMTTLNSVVYNGSVNRYFLSFAYAILSTLAMVLCGVTAVRLSKGRKNKQ